MADAQIRAGKAAEAKPPGRPASGWLLVLYVVVGIAPWIFILGHTALEVFVPACDYFRYAWPPPNSAGHWIVFFGGPWLIAMALLAMWLKAAGYRVKNLALIICSVAFGTCLVLAFTQPFATSHALDATRAECDRINLLQGNS